jgi:predicted nuclease with TOPRIM domain
VSLRGCAVAPQFARTRFCPLAQRVLGLGKRLHLQARLGKRTFMKSISTLLLLGSLAATGCDQTSQLRSELDDLREARSNEAKEAQDLQKEVAELRADLAKAKSELDKTARGESEEVLEQKQDVRDELSATQKKLKKEEAAVEDAKRTLQP